MADEIVELSLTGLAYGGEALGRDENGRMTFVPFALPGERVRVEIVDARKHWARGRLVEVLETSPPRIEPRCPHFAHCGGCHYQHMPYADQLLVKAEIVAEQLQRIGGFDDPPVETTVPSPEPWNYRNHMQFHLTPEGKLGFVVADSAEVFAIQECHLPEPALVDLWPRMDLAAIPGLTRVAVRSGMESDLLVALHGEGNPDVEMHLDLPASVVWLGPGGMAVLGGEGFVISEVLGRPFRISAGSFFQANTALAAELVKRAMQALEVKAGEVVYDLYAGVGLFSAAMLEHGARVVAVEESNWACDDYEINLHHFDKVTLYQATVEQALAAIEEPPNAVLVDPPRAGLSRDALDGLVEAAPDRLVYVSCDPATMARDGKRLVEAGYSLENVTPIDLFPQTYHIETLSRWRR
ncbi:MAG TPA: class I SAM-dependent RNA methyltransferase [Anaerolineae bacterium]|nr:class I SAM-dependent RNA methyltransferase [Anaerolineae bacterium]